MDAEDFYVALGANIRRERKVRGISQEALAEYLGITFQQIGKYERGTNRPPVLAILQMAQLFAVGVESLLPKLARVDKSPDAEEITADQFMLSRYFRLLPAIDRKAHIHYLKMLTLLRGQAAA